LTSRWIRAYLQFRWPDRLGAPGLDVRAPNTFGRINSSVQGAAGAANEARVIQFGLKLMF